ncbi:MAG: redoxin domain-containing protein, partial [Gammaproteobacteria bacterium]|nr:redoxin domain-containing protein [Gammaproteobacteria bacterium]
VSLDDVDSKAAFAEKYDLPFPILADVEKQAADSYNVVMKLGNMTLTKRETFLIDPAGVVVRHYSKVQPDTHTAEVLDGLRTLGAGTES